MKRAHIRKRKFRPYNQIDSENIYKEHTFITLKNRPC